MAGPVTVASHGHTMGQLAVKHASEAIALKDLIMCVCVLQSTISREGRTPWAHGTRALVRS